MGQTISTTELHPQHDRPLHTSSGPLGAEHIMALLGARYDLSPSHAHPLPQMLAMHHVTSPEWGSMLIEEHEAYMRGLFF
jgi:hypothetical protein